ncbi:MAG: hypothetical protein HC904_04860 [Blastochloris sp.]|nr:hypothetical protein [Blastochloris sp.]
MNLSKGSASLEPKKELWNSFLENFFAELIEISKAGSLSAFWHTSSKNRTETYMGSVLSEVAKKLKKDLDFKVEHYTYDIAFRKKSPSQKHPIPLVVIESENWPFVAHHEVRKLLSIAAPLKILITCGTWSKEQYPEVAFANKMLADWKVVIDEHLDVLEEYNIGDTGFLAFLVGECGSDSILRFYSFNYNCFSRIFEDFKTREIGKCVKPEL